MFAKINFYQNQLPLLGSLAIFFVEFNEIQYFLPGCGIGSTGQVHKIPPHFSKTFRDILPVS
jgi:hypothetical protein